jgi:hypothetical protein
MLNNNDLVSPLSTRRTLKMESNLMLHTDQLGKTSERSSRLGFSIPPNGVKISQNDTELEIHPILENEDPESIQSSFHSSKNSHKLSQVVDTEPEPEIDLLGDFKPLDVNPNLNKKQLMPIFNSDSHEYDLLGRSVSKRSE